MILFIVIKVFMIIFRFFSFGRFNSFYFALNKIHCKKQPQKNENVN